MRVMEAACSNSIRGSMLRGMNEPRAGADTPEDFGCSRRSLRRCIVAGGRFHLRWWRRMILPAYGCCRVDYSRGRCHNDADVFFYRYWFQLHPAEDRDGPPAPVEDAARGPRGGAAGRERLPDGSDLSGRDGQHHPRAEEVSESSPAARCG